MHVFELLSSARPWARYQVTGRSKESLPSHTLVGDKVPQNHFRMTSTSPYPGPRLLYHTSTYPFTCISPPEWQSPLKAGARVCTLCALLISIHICESQ